MSIKVENAEIFGWESAIRGMRNPLESWDKSDSHWEFIEDPSTINPNDEVKWVLGGNDLKLMKSLSKAGSDHAKFLRMITVVCDITAPLYWWKEFDTYKIGTIANSCSTMHKIHDKEFILDDFSCEHLITESKEHLESTIYALNEVRDLYMNYDKIPPHELDPEITCKKDVWWQIIQLLPTSYNQKRTIQLNYQVLKQMYFARRNHKLDEWRMLCKWIEALPYFKEIVLEG